MLQSPLVDLLGHIELDAPAFQQILDVQFQCPTMCNVYMQKMLAALAQPPIITDIPHQEFCNQL